RPGDPLVRRRPAGQASHGDDHDVLGGTGPVELLLRSTHDREQLHRQWWDLGHRPDLDRQRLTQKVREHHADYAVPAAQRLVADTFGEIGWRVGDRYDVERLHALRHRKDDHVLLVAHQRPPKSWVQ